MFHQARFSIVAIACVSLASAIPIGGRAEEPPRATNRPASAVAVRAPEVPGASGFKIEGPDGVLRPGEIEVGAVHLVRPARLAQLMRRLGEAASRDPAWWAAHVKSTYPGPVAYDARLGLSKEEYREMRSLQAKGSTETVTGARLKTTRLAEGAYALEGGKLLPELSGIVIDLAKHEVRTPFGALRTRTELDLDERFKLGACRGVQWKLEEVDARALTGKVIKLFVGRLKGSDRAVLRYEVMARDTTGDTRVDVVVYYDLPARH